MIQKLYVEYRNYNISSYIMILLKKELLQQKMFETIAVFCFSLFSRMYSGCMHAHCTAMTVHRGVTAYTGALLVCSTFGENVRSILVEVT